LDRKVFRRLCTVLGDASSHILMVKRTVIFWPLDQDVANWSIKRSSC
jgi:hypothetical protein